MKAVVMAAGSGSRWGNYLGVPKQLIKIEGEPILFRTIRLLKENKFEVYVTVPEKGYFGDLGVEEIVGKSDLEIDKFLNAEEESGAVFLWGDCYFTEDAIKKIADNKEDLMFFGRGGGSNLTGKRYGELFAVKTNKEFFKKAQELEKNKHKMQRCASWELYAYITTGKIYPSAWGPQKSQRDKDGNCIADPAKIAKHFTTIDDYTDDFDYPADYEKWIKIFNKDYFKRAWEKEYPKKYTVSFNIMAHPSRKDYIKYLKSKLGNVKVIWDTQNNIWHTRQKCLQDHIKKGKDFGITIQDDAIICDNFKEKAENFINQIGEKAIYNFFYTKFVTKEPIKQAKESNVNYFLSPKAGIGSEICFAFPTKLMKKMITACNKSDKRPGFMPDNLEDADWVMDERFVKESKLKTYFSVPSLVDHRVDIPSLYYPEDYINKARSLNRKAHWFIENEWVDNIAQPVVSRVRPQTIAGVVVKETSKTPGRKFKLVDGKIVPK